MLKKEKTSIKKGESQCHQPNLKETEKERKVKFKEGELSENTETTVSRNTDKHSINFWGYS